KPALPGPDGRDRTLGENLDDRAVEAKVRLAFSLDRQLKGTHLEVQAFRRTVVLHGTVDTPAQRQRALEIAQKAPAVEGVTDQISVGGGAPAGTATGGPPAAAPAGAGSSDLAARASAAERALQANPDLAPY